MKVTAGRMIKYIEEESEFNISDIISKQIFWEFEDIYNLTGMGERVVECLKEVNQFKEESDGNIYSIGKYSLQGFEYQLFINYIRDRICYYYTGFPHYDVKRSRGLLEDPSFKVDEYDEYLDYGFETIVEEKKEVETKEVETKEVETKEVEKEEIKPVLLVEKVDYTEFIDKVVSDFIGSSEFDEIMKSDSNKKDIDCKKSFFKGVSQKPEFKAMLKEDRNILNKKFNDAVENSLNNIEVSVEKEPIVDPEYQNKIKTILTTPIVDENNNILSYEEFKSNVDKNNLSIDVSTPNAEDDVKEVVGVHVSQNSPYTFTS